MSRLWSWAVAFVLTSIPGNANQAKPPSPNLEHTVVLDHSHEVCRPSIRVAKRCLERYREPDGAVGRLEEWMMRNQRDPREIAASPETMRDVLSVLAAHEANFQKANEVALHTLDMLKALDRRLKALKGR